MLARWSRKQVKWWRQCRGEEWTCVVFRRPGGKWKALSKYLEKTLASNSFGLEMTRALVELGVLLAEEWWEKVFEVVRVSDRIILIRMTIGKTVFVFVCVYAPQANLSEFEKDRFYQMLQCAVSKIPASEQLIVCGDWNGHIGSQSTGFEEVHGGQAIGKRNTEGERILEFAFANELVVRTHGSRRNRNTWSPTSLGMLLPR